MGIDKVLGVALKPIGKLVSSLTGAGQASTPSAAANNTVSNTAETDAAANQGKLNPLILTGPQGVLDPANPGKKMLLGM